MKFAESQHQNCFFLPETYDSVRIIQEVFSRDDFEKAFNFPAELCDTVRQTAEYKKSTESKVEENSRKRGHAEDFREELHVFKRMTPLALKNQLNEADSSIDEAKKALEKKKELLHNQRTVSVVTLDQQSAVVIDSIFVKK